MVTYINALRKMTAAVIEEIKWPRQEARIFRQFEKRIDELEATTDTVADSILDLETKLLTADEDAMPGLINEGISAQADLEAAKANAKSAKEWLDKLKAKAQE